MATPESLLISAVLESGSNSDVKILGLKPTDLLRYKPEFSFIMENGVPSKSTFRERFPDFKIRKVKEQDVPHLVDRIRNQRIRYEMQKAMETTLKQLDTKKPVELVNELGRSMEKISSMYQFTKDVDIVTNYEEMVEEVKRRSRMTKEGRQVGIPVGIPTLDKETGGLSPGDVWTLVARQGDGKTWVSLEFSASATIHGKSVLYISLEMTHELIGFRYHTLLYALRNPARKRNRFPNIALIRGQDIDIKKYREFLERVRSETKARFIVPELGMHFNFSTATVAAKIEEHHPDVVVIDYIGLMQGDGGKGKIENWQEIAQMMRDLKTMALRYKIPIVVNAQANRAAISNEGDVPKLHHIAGSDAIGANSDRVIALKLLGPSRLRIGIIKNRHGRQGLVFDCKWNIDEGFLREIPQKEQFDEE